MNHFKTDHIITTLCIIVMLSGCFVSLLGQEAAQARVLLDVPSDTVWVPLDTVKQQIRLSQEFIIPGSEKLHVGSFRLRPTIHYRFDHRAGTIDILRQFQTSDTLRVIYRRYPFPLINDYFHRRLEPMAVSDSLDSARTEIVREARPRFLQDIDTYQDQLQKSGSILRGIEIGNNQSLALNSGLNLQLSGKISDDVTILAALTDESTPIQPEGNTQTLREVDQVFVKINSPYLGGTIGDFNLVYGNSLFGNLQRKLQGVTIDNTVKSTRQQLTFGTSRGFFHSNRFLAQEGNQGPYQLTGRNGEREIIVLAGTERVYVDGNLQVRGENNDYIIDYSVAQITFTSKRLITSENRIEVDFEYTNAFQRYGRNLLGASTRSESKNGRIHYDIRAFREWDDTNNLLEDNIALTPQEESALAAAGDDARQASVSSAVLDPGNGNYALIDTVISGVTYQAFQFVGTGQGDYRIRFTGVGAGQGDYRRDRLGVYSFVGPGRGSYLPIRLVPLAANKRFIDMAVGVKVTDNWSIDSEFAVSDFDRNIFSSIDDGDNQGNALRLSSTLRDTALTVAGRRLGNLQMTTRWTRQQNEFDPLDRPLEPEYAYKWNLGENALNTEENSFEWVASYLPFPYIKFDANFGIIDKGSDIASQRRSGQLQLQQRFLPNILYRVEDVASENLFDESQWLRQTFNISRPFGRFLPGLRIRREDRNVETLSNQRVSGFIFDEQEASLKVDNLLKTRWEFKLINRIDRLYDPFEARQTRELADTRTYEAQAELMSRGAFQGRLSLSFRDKDFDPFFEQLPNDSILSYQPDPQFQDTSWQDRQSHIANMELQYRNKAGTINSRLDYRIASELQGIRERVFLPVDDNRGNFVFDSTLNEYLPDPQGDFILILLQTGEFESVTRMEAGWQFQYRPTISRRKGAKQPSFWKNFSTLSYVRLEEQSRTDNVFDLYLLNLSEFHNINSSLRGSYILNQDLYYNERNPNWGILARSRYRDILSNQFLDPSNNETRIVWERIFQMRRRLFERRLNVTGEYINTLNKRWVAAAPTRNRNIQSQAFIAKLNYRPSIRWQIQLDSERGLENDRNSDNLLRVNYWDLRPRISYALRGKSRISADMTWLNVQEVDNPFDRAIPFEMGKGKKIGNSWQWNLRFEYFINTNVTINANYNGRKDAQALRTLHLGKAEVRMFF